MIVSKVMKRLIPGADPRQSLRRARHAAAICLAVSLTGCGKLDVPAEPVITGIAFVGLSVSDLGATSELLVDAAALEATGFSPEDAHAWIPGAEQLPPDLALLRGVNSQLLLMQFPEAPAMPAATPVQGPGIAHVCFQVNQETRTYQRFLSAGATTIGAEELVQVNPRRPVYYGYVHDADRLVYEIEHVDIAALDLPEPPPHDHRIRHVSLATPDMDAAIKFYATLFAEAEPRRIGRLLALSGERLDGISGLSDSRVEMAWFQSRNLELELVQYKSHPTERPAADRPIEAIGYNLVVFDVTDIEESRTRVLQAGGRIVAGSDASGQRFLARDIDGNLLGFQLASSESTLSSAVFSGNGT